MLAGIATLLASPRNPTHQDTVRGILLKLQMPRVVPPARLRMSHRDRRDRELMMARATTTTDLISITGTLGSTSTSIGQSSNPVADQSRRQVYVPPKGNKIMRQIAELASW